MNNPYFWRSQYSVDNEQRERIESLEESLQHQTQRLRSQLAKAQGNLESRLSALARAFDAFVELSDVRAELTLHGDAAVARHRVRGFLTDILAGRAATLRVDDVPGYWLVSAARALDALIAGDQPGAVEHTTTATEIDAPRSTLFLTATTALLDLPGMTAVQLADLLPAAGGGATSVTHAQRAIWLAAAAGQFGAAGRAILRERLTALMSTASEGDERDQWRAAVLRLDGAKGATGLPPQRRAAIALAALRAHCAGALDMTPASSDVDGTTAGEADPLADIVRALLDEGSPAEIPLMRRSEELRRIVESDATPPAPPQLWDVTAGTVAELVRADFAPGTPPGRRSAAMWAARRWLTAVADDLAREATSEPPRTLTIRAAGHTVTVGPNGADPAQYAAAERHIAIAHQTSTRPRLVAGIGGAIAVAVTVAGFATGLAWLGVLALIGAGAAAMQLYNQTRTAAGLADAATEATAALQRDITKVQQRLQTDREAATTGGRQARHERDELATLLS